MKIIGFGDRAQVGKDTATDYLQRKYPGKVTRVSFADKVKQIAMDLFDLSWEQCYGPKEIKEAVDVRYGKSPREIMQGIGDKMREIYGDVWILAVMRDTIPGLIEKGYDCFIFSDVRYPNEADMIKKHGGVVVRLLRDAGGTLVGADHPSETAMRTYEGIDFTIENNGSFEELFAKVDQIMEEINYYVRAT